MLSRQRPRPWHAREQSRFPPEVARFSSRVRGNGFFVHARLDDFQRHAAGFEEQPARALPEARTSGSGTKPEGGGRHCAINPSRCVRCRSMIAAAVSSMERRCDVDHRPVVPVKEPARAQDFIRHGLFVGVGRVLVIGIEREKPVLADSARCARGRPPARQPGDGAAFPARPVPSTPARAGHWRS